MKCGSLGELPWTEKRCNEEVLKEVGQTRKIMSKFRKRQSRFFWTHHEARQARKNSNNGKDRGQKGSMQTERKYAGWADKMSLGTITSGFD